jgi:HAD superfamily hydrolase (TIGR01509 family)
MSLATPAGPIRAVVLDMGGVLLDMLRGNGLPVGALEREGRQRLQQRLRAASGRNVDDQLLDRALFDPWAVPYAGRYDTGHEAPWEPHLDGLARETGYPGDPLELLEAWLGPYLEALRPLPGVHEAVAALAREVPLAVVSNVPAPGRFYRDVLGRHGLQKRFRVLLFSYDEGSRKPSPRMLERAVALLGAPASRVLMVGDRRDSDVAAGRAAGTRTAWLTSERADGPLPDLEAPDLGTLVARLRG